MSPLSADGGKVDIMRLGLWMAAVVVLSAGVAMADEADGGGGGFHRAELIEPLGITALSLITLTVALGLLRRRHRVLLKLHKCAGILAFLAAVAHGLLVMSLH